MKTTPVPYLTRRDCGELKSNRPQLPVGELAHRLKGYWFDGMKQGQMAKITGYGVDYIMKFTACFSRALRQSPTAIGEGQKPEIDLQPKEKNLPKKPSPKKRKSLKVNFPTPFRGCDTLRGVTKHRGRGFKAQIRIGKRVKYLGIYDTIQEAAQAYNLEAARVFGRYATLNNLE